MLPPIPESRIHAYGQRRGLQGDVLDGFVFVIRRMDGTRIAWVRDEQAEAEARRNKK